MKNKRVIIAVIIMVIVSWLGYKGYDVNFFQTLNPLTKHLINFGLLVTVALTGCFAIWNFREKWLLLVWILFYCSGIVLLVIIGIVDLVHRISNHLIRDSVAPFRMFLTSPLPFLVILFLRQTLKGKGQAKQ